LMYEALDSRKTLLKRRTYRWQQKKLFKIKICSMYTLNRMEQKNEMQKSEAIRLYKIML
jgi:hypothetical protein